MAVIPVELAGRSYEVRVGSGLLADLVAQCGPLLRKKAVPVITDANVAEHWKPTVDAALTAGGFEPRWLVLDPGESAVPLTLRVELQEFSQIFDTAETSSGLVRLRATLVEAKGGADRLVAQKVFVVQRPAVSADAPGGVRALKAATDAAVDEIGAWLQQQFAK